MSRVPREEASAARIYARSLAPELIDILDQLLESEDNGAAAKAAKLVLNYADGAPTRHETHVSAEEAFLAGLAERIDAEN